MLEVQQFLPFHILGRFYLVLVKVLTVPVNTLSENADFVRLASVLESDAPEKGGAIFNEGDGQTES
jgi:hypothetical protein